MDGTDRAALVVARQDESAAPLIGCTPVSVAGFGAGDRPVINVSWRDVPGYTRWLNETVGLDPDDPAAGAYRLPTETKWEFAARAGKDTAYTNVH